MAYQPPKALPPGYTLQRCMDTMGMTVEDLAVETRLSSAHIKAILLGNASIDLDIAQRLEKAVTGSAVFWLNLEHNYQESLKRMLASIASNESTKGLTFTAQLSKQSTHSRKYDIGYTFIYERQLHVITDFWEPSGHYLAKPTRKDTYDDGSPIITPLLSEADIDNCMPVTDHKQAI